LTRKISYPTKAHLHLLRRRRKKKVEEVKDSTGGKEVLISSRKGLDLVASQFKSKRGGMFSTRVVIGRKSRLRGENGRYIGPHS